ncbi:5-(carboxyamino)imidazole ribonucleotide mutase [Helicobacter sp. 13S00477-4]|uniref:5-(carboxyamino)imidazole ribonucleotide mutase n=1 Tax=Helicobacter sp. 13S00477-4 TaxID=1905759 RepID=UPI000BA78ADE|nr:5-(carboxyamino)imidazole ribonucleotide mutase [Helicobacter sp. 13S00477-4]PAF52800.1 5-(carboxyamino)imidazole ribonucleotide mutase [Helicobacter sp. 13S00477-4]
MEFISIIMGSKTDWTIMSECTEILKQFDVKYEVIISSAHRTPQRTKEYVAEAEKKGVQVFIAAAGMAAHLAGAIASQTCKPVIGVPLTGGALDGLDALLSTVQMPAGMPVGTLAIGKAGAINAAYMAIQILSLKNNDLYQKLLEDRIQKAKKIQSDSQSIEIKISNPS